SERLPLVNVDIQHMGIYRCVADNFIKPPAEHLSQLLVFHAPRTRVVQNSVGQAQNRRFSAKLECIVQGHPEPTITWERVISNGRVRITDNQKFDINKQTKDLQNLMAMESWYSLKIINVQANDYTTYYCIAENNFGRANSTFVLFETTECQGANCPSLPPSAAMSTFSMNPVFLFPYSFLLRATSPSFGFGRGLLNLEIGAIGLRNKLLIIEPGNRCYWVKE
ncbi:lachesin, partial [Biomphalaria pfeifferi]